MLGPEKLFSGRFSGPDQLDQAQMRQAVEKTAGRILRVLSETWEKGISLPEAVLFYLESALGITGGEAFGQLMDRADDPDHETVLELILFPELRLRLALEPLLETGGLSAAQEGRITAGLCAAHPRINLWHPRMSEPVTAALSLDQTGSFVSRLYLARRLPADVCRALQDCHPEFVALSSRVLMRCTGTTMGKEKRQFAVRFIRKATGRPGFRELFDTFWGLIGDAPSSGDPGPYFLERQRGEKKLLHRILKFQNDLDRYGMEYLMMSKYQVPPEGMETVAERLWQMDTVICDILGLRPLPWDW